MGQIKRYVFDLCEKLTIFPFRQYIIRIII